MRKTGEVREKETEHWWMGQ